MLKLVPLLKYSILCVALFFCLAPQEIFCQESTLKNWGSSEHGKQLLEKIKEQFAGMEHRYLGSEGHQKASAYIEAYFKEKVGEQNSGYILHDFPVFKPGEFHLKVGEDTLLIHTFEPNYIEVSNIDPDRLMNRIIYIKDGSYDKVDGKDLKNSIALMDMKSKNKWQDLVPFGVEAFIFIESDDVTTAEYDQKIGSATLSMPRYFISKENADVLKKYMGDDFSKDARAEIEVKKRSAWLPKDDLKSHYALVEGKNTDRIMIVGMNYDTNGAVPELSVNAQDTINLALQLELLDQFTRNKPEVSVLFVSFACHYRGTMSADDFFWYTSTTDALIKKEIDFFAHKETFHGRISEFYGDFTNERIEEMRYGTVVINKQNYTWKKAIIDLLRSKMNNASERILLLTYQLKKIKDGNEELINSLGANEGSSVDRKQTESLKSVVYQIEESEDPSESLQNKLIQIDIDVAKALERLREVENKILLLTRNFTGDGNNQKEVDALSNEKESLIKSLETKRDQRLLLQRDLSKLHQEKKFDAVNEKQYQILANNGEYLVAQIELFENQRSKTDAITIQKLYNSKFAEQYFIEPKEGEERKLLPEKYIESLKDYHVRISALNKSYSLAATKEIERIQHNSKIRSMTIGKDGVPKSVLYLDFNMTYNNDELGLFPDLVLGTDALPPVLYGRNSICEFKDGGNFVKNALNISNEFVRQNQYEENLLIDSTLTTSFNKFVIRPISSANSASQTAGVPAVSIVTCQDRHLKNNTPMNDYNNVETGSLSKIWNYLCAFVPMMSNDSNMVKESLKLHSSGFSSYIFSFVQQDNLAISVPETPVSDVLFSFGTKSINPGSGRGQTVNGVAGYFAGNIYMSNKLGVVPVRNVRQKRTYGVEAYQFDESFQKIVNVLDMRKGSSIFKVDLLSVTDDFKMHTLPVFNCEKIDLYHNYDLSEMSTFQNIKVLDGIQNSVPDNLAVSGMPIAGGHPWVRSNRLVGGISIFVTKGRTVKFILRDRVLINSKYSLANELSVDADHKKHANGLGYSAAELDRGSLIWSAVKDVHALNSFRQNLLNSKGVKDSLVEELHSNSTLHLDKAKSAIENNQYSSFYESMFFSYGMAYATYPKILQVMNDMIKAVVFYLALVLPFSFFLQRLLFPVTAIEKQLGLNALVFFVVFILFRYVHPAFELTDAPLIVLIAFIQIVLALFVFNVLYNKFDSRIKLLQGRTSGGDSAGANIVSQALVIGVNNMRKRKVRTLLTCTTIVLVTFTMLSFTSISSTVDPTMVRKESESKYTGVFYSKNAWSAINPEVFLQAFPNHLESIKRAWFSRGGLGGSQTPFLLKELEKDSLYEISTLLGLEKKEDGFISKLPIRGTYFSSDSAKEIILSEELAAIINPETEKLLNTEVKLLGEMFKVVGFFDGEKLDEIKDLRGVGITPQVRIGAGLSGDLLEEFNNSDEEANDNYRPMSNKLIAIVPYETLMSMGGRCVSVSLKYDSAEKMWQDAKTFTTFSSDNLYVGSQGDFKTSSDAIPTKKGTFFIGTGFSTAIGGLADLIIPLIISATIIMNTMLGAVYERKKEIEIYTSVGLNPTQIGFFFIAEALVYGIIGSVAGYLIGQFVAKGVNKFELLNIDLNFSSLLVVYVMILTILIVVVSTIYPAFAAVKAAQPSGESLAKSEAQGDKGVMEVLFPFSYTDHKRFAVNAFLREYIMKFADASTGSFMAKPGPVEVGMHYDKSSDFTTEKAFIQKFNIALTPYDLGVTEDVELVTFYHPRVNAYMIKIVIYRISGTDSNWLRTNKPFSDEIRKLLLRWRVEPQSVQDKCQIEGERLFPEEVNQLV